MNAFTCFVGGFFDRLQSEAVIERLAQISYRAHSPLTVMLDSPHLAAKSGSGAAQSFVNATIVVLEYRIGCVHTPRPLASLPRSLKRDSRHRNFGPDSLRLVMLLQRLAQLDVGISRMSDGLAPVLLH